MIPIYGKCNTWSVAVTRRINTAPPYEEELVANLEPSVETYGADEWSEFFESDEETHFPCQRFLVRIELPEMTDEN